MANIQIEKGIKCGYCGGIKNVFTAPCPINESKNKISLVTICTDCFTKKCSEIFKK